MFHRNIYCDIIYIYTYKNIYLYIEPMGEVSNDLENNNQEGTFCNGDNTSNITHINIYSISPKDIGFISKVRIEPKDL